jgi:glutathione peroxidase
MSLVGRRILLGHLWRDISLVEKVDVNGPDRHPLYNELTSVADADGEAGDIQWNFEKFLISANGEVVGRFRPRTEPMSDEVISAIEAQLP